MGRSRNTITNTSTNTALDPASQAYVNQIRGVGQGLFDMANAPGSWVHGLTPEQLRGMEQMGVDLSGVGGGLDQYWTDLSGGDGTGGSLFSLQDLMGMRSELPPGLGQVSFDPGHIDPARIQAFMNPYEAAVVDASAADAERQREAALSRAAAEATAQGAFGGSRSGLLQAQTVRDVNQDEAARAAALRHQGFETALGTAAGEWSTRGNIGMNVAIAGMQGALQAAALQQQGDLGFAGLAQDFNRMSVDDATRRQALQVQQGLGFAGLQQQGDIARANLQQGQALNLFNMGEARRQIEQDRLREPFERGLLGLQALSAGLGPTGSSTTSRTVTTPPSGGSFLSGLAGGASTGYGAATGTRLGGPWGALIGGAIGGLGGLFNW